jgi:hypothetical protein
MAKVSSAAQTAPVYQIKVVLMGSDPEIWRRFCVRSTIRLSRLHDVVQVVMGWTDSHLHAFHAGKDTYQVPFPGFDDMSFSMSKHRSHDERKFTLGDLLQRPRQKLVYEYDFGDSWHHGLILEKVLPADPELKAALCLAGENGCPLEDTGGLYGYYHMLEALADPKHKDHGHFLDWIDGPIDPKAFDLAGVNRILKKIKM